MVRLQKISLSKLPLDPKLHCKSHLSRSRQLVEFDQLTSNNFQLNVLSCILYGISTVDVASYKQRLQARKLQRINQSISDADIILKANPSLKTFSNTAFVRYLQHKYDDYRIIIFANVIGSNYLFAGLLSDKNKHKNVYLVESSFIKHRFNVVNFPAAYFNFRFFCQDCIRFCNNKKQHFCVYKYIKCDDFGGAEGKSKYETNCNRIFKGKKCFENHLANKTCINKKKCNDCKQDYKVTKRKHICAIDKCPKCGIAHKLGYCYVLTAGGKKKKKKKTSEEIEMEYRNAIYFDIETIQLKDGTLEPVLLVCCYMTYDGSFHYKTFSERGQVVTKFIDFLLTYDQRLGVYTFSNYVCVAHNFKGFDGTFIAEEMHNREHYSLDVIYCGTKLQMLLIRRLKLSFIDSINFVHCSLRNLSKMFGSEHQKTFFPYDMLTEKHIDYKGKLPSIKHYDIDNLQESERDDFFKFYDKQKQLFQNVPFDLKKVLYTYCKQDVFVLATCMEKFRRLILFKTVLDPFQKDVTLAGICIRDFLTNHMKPHSIGIIPAKGYFRCASQSKKALDFLSFKSWQLSVKIRTVKDPRGEKQIGQYKMDGFCRKLKLIFDFHGCWYHGCNSCFYFTDYSYSKRFSMTQLYDNTIARELEIKQIIKTKYPGYKYESVWEHEFEDLKKTKIYKEYLKATNQKEIDPKTDSTISERGFFYGGRVNAIQFYLKRTENTEIKYKDVCSLYPFVNKYRSYPKGHPSIIRSKFDYSMGKYFGIMKCKILPPKKLFHPVLPSKIHNKNMFVLCRSCAEEESKEPCKHNKSERVLYGEWCTPEIYHAMLHGYKLLEIYCVLHYPEKIDYNGEYDQGLFGGYIDKWLKIKVEASGWPPTVKTEMEKDLYIQMYKLKENITIEKHNVS